MLVNDLVFVIGSLIILTCVEQTLLASNPRLQIEFNQNDKTTKTRSGCDCVCGLNNRQMRIVGGNKTRPHEFPWMAGLSRNGKLYCGASLITRRHLLTAAHCIDGYALDGLKISLGKHFIKSDKVKITENIDVDNHFREDDIVYEMFRISASLERNIKSATTHSDFNIFNFNNDIAILELDEPVEFNDILQPVCLPTRGQNYTSRLGLVTGWGRTDEHTSPSNFLRKVSVPIWSQQQCLDAGYGRKKITANMICAGFHDGGRDACQGDSGGPLHLDGNSGSMQIIGLVSWGRGCARPNYPGVYTRVVNYLDWVYNSLDGECLCKPKFG